MTTATQGHSHLGLVAGDYESDDAVPRGSPLMTAYVPKLAPSPSPPPDIPATQIRHSSGDTVLVSYLDNGRRPDIARAAGYQNLPIDEEDYGSEDDSDDDDYRRESHVRAIEGEFYTSSREEPTQHIGPAGRELQHLAAGALQAVTEPHDISSSTRKLSLRDSTPVLSHPANYQHRDKYGQPMAVDARSPSALLTPVTGSGELPPLQSNSPRDGQSLPSLRSQLGDISRLSTEPPHEKDPRHGPTSAYARSPSASMPYLHPNMHHAGPSPPTSPNDGFNRGPASPQYMTSPQGYNVAPMRQHPSPDYSTAGETPSTDQSGSTPATSVASRMSIDGLTNPAAGNFVCNEPGCNAQPFQTQYLLNSHMNVHSSARPHFCPVAGCPRSLGGKGFKRKNEMIRHGLVHESPGYVCPFCPEREHRYPRPDNLQRHVRAHHEDKDKNDPLLRDVLAQRPDGPNRGRRRRAN